MTVIFVCTGNINRSAAGSVIATAYGHTDVISAGTSINAREARRMAKRTRDPLITAGIDPYLVITHRSQYIGDLNLINARAIIGFQPSHRQWCKEAGVDRVYHDIAELAYHPEWTKRGKVPDPGFDKSAAEPVVQYLLKSVDEIIRRVS